MDLVLGRVVDQRHCEAYVGITKITDLFPLDDTVIFAESLEVLVMAPKVKLLGLQIKV